MRKRDTEGERGRERPWGRGVEASGRTQPATIGDDAIDETVGGETTSAGPKPIRVLVAVSGGENGRTTDLRCSGGRGGGGRSGDGRRTTPDERWSEPGVQAPLRAAAVFEKRKR